MDKSWVDLPPYSSEYQSGLNNFLDIAFANAFSDGTIRCPCRKCCNIDTWGRQVVHQHLTLNRWDKGYSRSIWSFHGELEQMNATADASIVEEDENDEVDDMGGMLHGAFGMPPPTGESEEHDNEPNPEAGKFYKLVEDAEQELYPGCKKYSVLSFIVRLYHIKCLHGLSDKGFTVLLDLLKDVFPDLNETLPKSFYYTKKIIEELGLEYTKIDACPNNCMLYWKDSENATSCSTCKASRWKTTEDGETFTPKKHSKKPAKVLRYFPLKSRLQRLFMSDKTAGLMRWHANDRTMDGVLRHPADSSAWVALDKRYPEFAAEARNVRLGLATDGFNPFGTMSHSHSTWPVVLMPYNLPPWLCMKQPYFIMSMLIPGPTAPGNDIDVFLQPLIDELYELWVDGIYTYDASLKQNFTMRAAVLWTINDFPAYANLSGWSTKGYLACPHCNVDVDKNFLKASRKICYMCHRRFLPTDHSFRHDTTTFNGKTELRPPPPTLSGTQQLEQMGDIRVTFGKGQQLEDPGRADGWKKKSIFFTLPYWEHLLIRHNLDVMHTEKNICDSLIGTLLNIPHHTKDSLNARVDLVTLNIREDLHPFVGLNGKPCYKPACYTMSRKEKDIFLNVLGKVKVPDGYAANISRCVNIKQRTLNGLKSHDYHIIMQQLLPIAVRKSLPTNVASVLIELSSIFRELCSKVGTVNSFTSLEARIALTLCHLERIFPPAFFDVMMHLAIHLPSEAKIAGPVHYRWMYPIERYLMTLKSYVRNKSQPEGSIAEGYLVEECLTFCTRYLHDVETKSTRLPRNYEPSNAGSREGLSIFLGYGRAMGKADIAILSHTDLELMHSYLLFNCPELAPFVGEHYQLIVSQYRNRTQSFIKRKHRESFPAWLKDNVDRIQVHGGYPVEHDLNWLVWGPRQTVRKYKRFVINGFRFRTIDVDKKKSTQNSGVVVTAKTTNDADRTYYGYLIDIIELDYSESRKVVLFKCDWVYGINDVKVDNFGITIVNSQRFSSTVEPFILASQALQVFYVDDTETNGWKVAVKILPRDFFDMAAKEGTTDDATTFFETEPFNNPQLDQDILNTDSVLLPRQNVPLIVTNRSVIIPRQPIVPIQEGNESLISPSELIITPQATGPDL